MAEEATISRPYANAVFTMAKASDGLDAWSGMLAQPAGTAQDERAAARLSHPTATAEDNAALLKDVMGDELDVAGKRLVDVLADNGRLELLPDIAQEFESLRAQEQHTIDVQVISAYEVADATAAKLTEALAKKFDAEINLEVQIDKDLMGGAIIRAGDVVIDGTVKGRLTKMRDRLAQV